jgi:hypothetical protein
MDRSRLVIVVLVTLLALPATLIQPGIVHPSPIQDVNAVSHLADSVHAVPHLVAAAARRRDGRDLRGEVRRRGAHQREQARQAQAAIEAQCEAAGLIWLPRSGTCTHGPDPAPSGVDVTQRAAPLPASRARVAAEATVCDGDGQTGPRVQVLYARGADVRSHFDAYLPSFRAWAASVDGIVRASALEAGGGRRVRFVTTPGCNIDVLEVVLVPAGDDAFDAMVQQLRARGHNRTDRKYLVFVDTTAAGICGLGNMNPDDRPGQANANNSGPMYARIDAGCWNQPQAAAHELFHTMGAVQNSAPNTTGYGHCIDEYDVMCYPDPPLEPEMRFDCPSVAHDNRLDCSDDDYFDPSPALGSYLASHWNTANNQFLVGSATEPLDTEPPTVSWTAPVGNGELHEVAAGTVALEVTVEDDSEINRVEFGRWDPVRERWFALATDTTAPYATEVQVAQLQPEDNYVLATAYDAWTNQAEAFIFLWKEGTDPPVVPEPEPPADFMSLAITAPADGAKLKANTTTTVAVNIVNASQAVAVEVRSCEGSLCSWPTAVTIGADADAPLCVPWQPRGPGRFTLLARADDQDQTLSEPITVVVEKAKEAKKKKKKRRRR